MSEKPIEKMSEKMPEKPKADPQAMLVKANLKHLRLPTMHAEFEKLAREAASANESYEQYLLRLTELEVMARSANVLRVTAIRFPLPILWLRCGSSYQSPA